MLMMMRQPLTFLFLVFIGHHLFYYLILLTITFFIFLFYWPLPEKPGSVSPCAAGREWFRMFFFQSKELFLISLNLS